MKVSFPLYWPILTKWCISVKAIYFSKGLSIAVVHCISISTLEQFYSSLAFILCNGFSFHSFDFCFSLSLFKYTCTRTVFAILFLFLQRIYKNKKRKKNNKWKAKEQQTFARQTAWLLFKISIKLVLVLCVNVRSVSAFQ